MMFTIPDRQHKNFCHIAGIADRIFESRHLQRAIHSQKFPSNITPQTLVKWLVTSGPLKNRCMGWYIYYVSGDDFILGHNGPKFLIVPFSTFDAPTRLDWIKEVSWIKPTNLKPEKGQVPTILYTANYQMEDPMFGRYMLNEYFNNEWIGE